MFRKENLILTFAGGDAIFRDPTFWVFVNSLRNVPNADAVILTHAMPDDVRARLEEKEVQVVDVTVGEIHFLYRDRHLCYWNYLNEHGHKYKHVLATDCRDVVFQANPFDWVAERRERFASIKGNTGFLDHFVVLIAEGHKMCRSGFACIEHFEFERDVPRPFLKTDRNRDVVNGGTFLGTPLAMQSWHFLVWTTQMKTIGRCTDQATVNWLMHYLDQDETYSVSFPQTDNLCLTGEGVKEGAVEPLLREGECFSPLGKKYYFIHQWDRLDWLREEMLAQYAK